MLHFICQQIWKTQQWPQDWKGSVFIPTPKKGNVKECSNFRITALISHTSKVMLKIPEEHLLLIYWLKAFTVWITINCRKFFKRWEYQTIWPASWEICDGQEAIVRTGHGTTDWFQIGKGVHQGCILSPCLFNLSAKYIMLNAGLDETQAGIKIARRNINNLRYADDTTLMAEIEEELKSLLRKVKEKSEKAGLKLSIQKIRRSWHLVPSVQFSSVAQLCLTLCEPMDCNTLYFPPITNSQSLLKLMSIELVMPSNHLILCCPLFILYSIFPSIRAFSNESVLCIRWPKYWSFSFSISPSNEHPGLISSKMDWLDLLAVQVTLKNLLQHHSLKASIFWCSAFFMVQLSHPYMTTGKTIGLTRWNFVGKVMSLLLICCLGW